MCHNPNNDTAETNVTEGKFVQIQERYNFSPVQEATACRIGYLKHSLIQDALYVIKNGIGFMLQPLDQI
jgi:hypothetical protein